MKEYKVVPCHGRVVAKPKAELADAFNAFAEIIAQESLGGWELVTVMPVSVVTKKGRTDAAEEPYNALVFTRNVEEEKK